MHNAGTILKHFSGETFQHTNMTRTNYELNYWVRISDDAVCGTSPPFFMLTIRPSKGFGAVVVKGVSGDFFLEEELLNKPLRILNRNSKTARKVKISFGYINLAVHVQFDSTEKKEVQLN